MNIRDGAPAAVATFDVATQSYSNLPQPTELIQHNDGTIEKVAVASAPSTVAIIEPTDPKTPVKAPISTGVKVGVGTLLALFAYSHMD